MKMRTNFVFAAMLAMILAWGMTVVGCDNNPDNNDDNNNNNNGTDIVPADLRGVWTMTASSVLTKYTFTANSFVQTASNGETVLGTLTYTVTACSTTTEKSDANFPSGYSLTLKITAMEGDTGSGVAVGDVQQIPFYLNTTKNQLQVRQSGGNGNIFTKQ